MNIHHRHRDVPKLVSRLAILTCAAATALSTTACKTYMMVRSTIAESTRDEPSEVTATPQYRKTLPAIDYVGIQPPDSCASLTAAEATGAARPEGTYAKTSCGVLMTEIEVALSKAGYRVANWSNLSAVIRSKNTTPINAAKELGAQLLFQVNSLERVRVQPGRDVARPPRLYCSSDEDTRLLGPAWVAPEEIAEVDSLVTRVERQYLPPVQLGIAIDVSAVLVDTGQTVWFYRWTKPQTVVSDQTVWVFLSNRRHWAIQRWPPPPPRGTFEAAPYIGAGPDRSYSTFGAAASPVDKAYHDVVRVVVAGLVQQFKSGQEDSLRPPPRPRASEADPAAECSGQGPTY